MLEPASLYHQPIRHHPGTSSSAGRAGRHRETGPGVIPAAVIKRYHRFEPITVRAAARLVRLARFNGITGREVLYYVRELAELDRSAGTGAHRRLMLLAKR